MGRSLVGQSAITALTSSFITWWLFSTPAFKLLDFAIGHQRSPLFCDQALYLIIVVAMSCDTQELVENKLIQG